MIHRLVPTSFALMAGLLAAAVGFGGTPTAANAQGARVLAPEWKESRPFVVRFQGEIVESTSSRALGYVETRTEQYGEMGVTTTANDNGTEDGLAGSAWIHLANDLGMGTETQLEEGAKNDYEVTHFDGRGGAVRMSARQCPPPSVDNGVKTQGYADETGAGFRPCQCTFEATPTGGVGGCTLPTKYSCLPNRETGCVPSEEDGCPLSELIQRRWWGHAPPACAVRPLEAAEVIEASKGGHHLPWSDGAEFAVCKSAYAFGGQIEAVSVGEDNDGIPTYDVEGYCEVKPQTSDCVTSYLANVETISSAGPEELSIFLDADPAGFVACLGDEGAIAASAAFCNGRGSWTIDGGAGSAPGGEPSPFRCVCDDATMWTGDRCDVTVTATATATTAVTAPVTANATATPAATTPAPANATATPAATTPAPANATTTTAAASPAPGPSPCLPCHPGTFGPCQHDAPGDTTCAEREAGEGSGCPVGFSECTAYGGGGDDATPGAGTMCTGCFGQSSGPCRNPADRVCFNFQYEVVCPPGTQPC